MINEWNKLPNDCVNASSVNMFKNTIDRYLIRAGYTKGGLHIYEKIVGLSISQWLPCPLAIWNLLFEMAILLNLVKLSLNIAKSKYMTFQKTDASVQTLPLKIDNINIEYVN